MAASGAGLLRVPAGHCGADRGGGPGSAGCPGCPGPTALRCVRAAPRAGHRVQRPAAARRCAVRGGRAGLHGAGEGYAQGERERVHQRSHGVACGQGLIRRQPGAGHQAPGEFGLEHLDGRVLEFGLFRGGAEGGCGERIDPRQTQAGRGTPAQVFTAPVHGQENLLWRHFVAGLHGHHDAAAHAGDVGQVTVLQALAGHVLRVHLHGGFGRMAEQAGQGAGATHAVPLVAQAAGGQAEGIACAARLGHAPVLQRHEACASIRGGEDTVFVQPGLAGVGRFRAGPLLRALRVDQCVAQACDVEVAPARALAVLVPDGLGAGVVLCRGIGEQRGQAGAQPRFEPVRELHRNLPVVPRFSGGRGRRCARGRCGVRCSSRCRSSRPRCWRAAAGRHSRRWRWWQRRPAPPRTRRAAGRGAPWPGRACFAPDWCRRSTGP